MKKLLLILAFLGLSVAAISATIGGTINAPLVYQDSNGVLMLGTYDVNPSGTPAPTPAPTPTFLPTPAGGYASADNQTAEINILKGATSTAAPLYVIQAKLQPTNYAAITLTGSTSWQGNYVTCTAQPCTLLWYNQSASTMLYWIDRGALSSPAFSGISITAGQTERKDDIAPGDKFWWRYEAASGNGFLVNRY